MCQIKNTPKLTYRTSWKQNKIEKLIVTWFLVLLSIIPWRKYFSAEIWKFHWKNLIIFVEKFRNIQQYHYTNGFGVNFAKIFSDIGRITATDRNNQGKNFTAKLWKCLLSRRNVEKCFFFKIFSDKLFFTSYSHRCRCSLRILRSWKDLEELQTGCRQESTFHDCFVKSPRSMPAEGPVSPQKEWRMNRTWNETFIWSYRCVADERWWISRNIVRSDDIQRFIL